MKIRAMKQKTQWTYSVLLTVEWRRKKKTKFKTNLAVITTTTTTAPAAPPAKALTLKLHSSRGIRVESSCAIGNWFGHWPHIVEKWKKLGYNEIWTIVISFVAVAVQFARNLHLSLFPYTSSIPIVYLIAFTLCRQSRSKPVDEFFVHRHCSITTTTTTKKKKQQQQRQTVNEKKNRVSHCISWIWSSSSSGCDGGVLNMCAFVAEEGERILANE